MPISSNWSTRLRTARNAWFCRGQGIDGEDDPAREVEGRRDLQLAAVVVHEPVPLVPLPQRASQNAQGGQVAEHRIAVVQEHHRIGMLVQRHVHRQRRAMSREYHRLDRLFLQGLQHDLRLPQPATAAVDAKTVRHASGHEADVVGKEPLPLLKCGRPSVGTAGTAGTGATGATGASVRQYRSSSNSQ